MLFRRFFFVVVLEDFVLAGASVRMRGLDASALDLGRLVALVTLAQFNFFPLQPIVVGCGGVVAADQVGARPY